MNVSVCNKCGASFSEIVTACPHCGATEIHRLADLQEGEALYKCGHCAGVNCLGAPDNPKLGKLHHATDIRGVSKGYLPLTTENTVFACQHCKAWNWVILDDRISGFAFPCPECGATSHLASLGMKLVLAKNPLQKTVMGHLRAAAESLALKCGHYVYLPTLLLEREPASPLNQERTPAPHPLPPPVENTPASRQSKKEKTQPISFGDQQ